MRLKTSDEEKNKETVGESNLYSPKNLFETRSRRKLIVLEGEMAYEERLA